MRWNKYKVVCVVFIVFIMLTGLSTAVINAKQIGYNMLIGYKDNLDKDADILDKLRAIIAECEDGMSEGYILKNQGVNLYGGFQKLLGKRVINDVDPSNDVIKLDNGYLSFYTHEKSDIKNLVKNTVEFNNILKKQGIPLLYVQAPYKISKYDTELPKGINVYNNYNADQYLKGIYKENINYIDLRKLIKEDGLQRYSMFFKTDHHWTPKAGLWAFSKIANELNQNYGFNIDEKLWNKDSYNVKTYKNCFLGSQGKRTGIYYDGLDDFDIITPKFKTNFEVRIDSQNVYKTGEFKETLLDMSKFGIKDYFNTFTYTTYSGGDFGLVNIKNKINKNGKRILLIRDSFSCVLTPFLAQAVSNLDIVDLRQDDRIDLQKFIKENKPDIVIIMYNPSSIANDVSTFDFLSK